MPSGNSRSRRQRRLSKGRSRLAPPAFNMVALMDIFTILVFFLLVNSGELQDVPATRSVSLPLSYASEGVQKTVAVRVTPVAVWVNEQRVASLDGLAQSSGELVSVLEKLRSGSGPKVTVVGDKGTPYSVLKRVMRSCSTAGYERISLAVIQTGSQG